MNKSKVLEKILKNEPFVSLESSLQIVTLIIPQTKPKVSLF